MGIQYTNRNGDVYYLQQRPGKNGKPSYTLARKLTGTPVDVLPVGYEIHEAPERPGVFLRKCQPSPILPLEIEATRQALRCTAQLKHFIVAADGMDIVVYLPDSDPMPNMSNFGTFLSATQAQSLQDEILRKARYTKMMRFVLADPKWRHFTVDRRCFRGGIDKWYFLSGPAPLAKLLDQYAPHLGKDSFFELK